MAFFSCFTGMYTILLRPCAHSSNNRSRAPCASMAHACMARALGARDARAHSMPASMARRHDANSSTEFVRWHGAAGRGHGHGHGTAHGILERPGFSGSIQDLGPVKTMSHIDPNLYLVLNRHSLPSTSYSKQHVA